MNYFEQDMDGSMEPDEDGSWVKSEQADELYMALLEIAGLYTSKYGDVNDEVFDEIVLKARKAISNVDPEIKLMED